ncbi:MAG TPA: alpha/beta hydrolase [Actinoplanes sp.]|nr:alpha/beta hydrolase [Actinoplanes sp.]
MLRRLRLPALVVHGDADPLIRPAGGRATAHAIAGAKLVIYPGMGHDLPAALQPDIADEIAALARRWAAAR